MASPVPMKHIDREELYTNLEARIQYLHSFLDFSSSTLHCTASPSNTKGMNGIALTTHADDIEALISGAKYIKALVPAVVNIVYRKLLQYDITARAFTTKNTTQGGEVGEALHEDSPQIVHRKMFLRAYLNKLCSDPSKMEFWEYLDKVGYVVS